MDIQPISTKQLRQELPLIKLRIQEGETFFWIDRSKPVGIIQPFTRKRNQIKTYSSKKYDYKKLVEKLAGGIKANIHLTPNQLNKLLDARYEEHYDKKMLPR